MMLHGFSRGFISAVLGVGCVLAFANPALGQETWAPTSTVGAPEARSLHTAVWIGHRMLVWGGARNGVFVSTGSAYDLATDSWSPISTVGAPSARFRHTAVWTGSEMIVWGGEVFGTVTDTGGRYNPATDSWTPISTVGAPSARARHTAIWTGSEMIVWGGVVDPCCGSSVDTGARYDPLTDSWAPLSLINAPSARVGHSAVWSGTEMLIWGGNTGVVIPAGDGARYTPATDSWVSISTVSAPSDRQGHAAAWTGTRMVVWGGEMVGNSVSLGTGGIYDPWTDLWLPVSLANAPAPRRFFATVWTGREMIVWGGITANPYSGGRFDPETNTWSTMTALFAPAGDLFPSAVWSGGEMILWGGHVSGSFETNTGGIYRHENCAACRGFPTSLEADSGCLASTARRPSAALLSLLTCLGLLLLGRFPGVRRSRLRWGRSAALAGLILCAGVSGRAARGEQQQDLLEINEGARTTRERNVRLTLRAPDRIPPIVSMSLSHDGTEWEEWGPFRTSLDHELPPGEGDKTVFVRLLDSKGDQVLELRATIRLDSTPPEVEVEHAPESDRNEIVLRSTSTEAVAMQYCEDGGPWDSWRAYASHHRLTLSPGEGTRTLFVRYRDAAGNVSTPKRIVVRVRPSGAEADRRPALRAVELLDARLLEDGFSAFLSLKGLGFREMEVLVDGEVEIEREPFNARRRLAFSRTAEPHMVQVRLWDEMDELHEAAITFQEEQLLASDPVPQAPEEEASEGALFGEVSLGLWMTGLEFEAVTIGGPRKIDPGTAVLLQLSGGARVAGPVFVEGWGEIAQGDDLQILSGGANLGVSVLQTRLGNLDTRLSLFGGPLISALEVDDTDFGDFDDSVGVRTGISISSRLDDRFSLGARLEYRSVRYDSSEDVVVGDREASASGVALLFGFEYRF